MIKTAIAVVAAFAVGAIASSYATARWIKAETEAAAVASALNAVRERGLIDEDVSKLSTGDLCARFGFVLDPDNGRCVPRVETADP